MAAYYLEIRQLHIACVLLSGGFFTLRGIVMLTGSRWHQRPAVKRLSYANDCLLLLAGLMLIHLSGISPIQHSWLGVKLGLLVVYIGLGIFALRKGRTRGQRAKFFGAALLVYLYMLSVARAHHPLGVLAQI